MQVDGAPAQPADGPRRAPIGDASEEETEVTGQTKKIYMQLSLCKNSSPELHICGMAG